MTRGCQAIGCREAASPVPLGASLPGQLRYQVEVRRRRKVVLEDHAANTRVAVELWLCPVHLGELAAGLQNGNYAASLWDGGGKVARRLELELRASRGDEAAEWSLESLRQDDAMRAELDERYKEAS
jgi:hypothetical protein